MGRSELWNAKHLENDNLGLMNMNRSSGLKSWKERRKLDLLGAHQCEDYYRYNKNISSKMGSLWSGHHTYQRNSFFSCLGRVRSWQSSIYREQHLGRTEHQSSIQKEKFRSIRQEPQMEAE
jgi:hypothetical protein